ncbi:hypothetical protein IJV79_04840, partial [bacterium]|nr:hypothetical protein [bacterium]
MGNDIENLQVSVDTISDELQLIKTQNSRTALSLDEINSNLQNIAEKESVSKETFLTSQEQVAGYITSNLAERVNEVYRNVDTIKNSIETVNEVKAVEMREILGGLSLKISALQDAMKSYTDDKHTELKMILDDLNEVSKTTIANIERNNLFGFSGLNTNIEELSKAFAQSHDELTKSQAENVENLINSIFVLSNKIEAHFAVEDSSDEIASLIELVNDVKANLEATNVDMLSFIKSEFVDLKEVVKSLDLTALEEKMSALSMLLVSPSSQMDTVIAELNGQFEALKYTITATSTNSEVVDKVTSY